MRNSQICAFAFIIIVLAAQFYPVAASNHQDPMEKASYISMETVAALSMVSQLKVQTQPNNGLNIIELINASTNKTDTDGDRLPDSVEAVIGTDFNNTDSDFDRVDDYNETILYGSDPLEPDSNYDGLADYFEVMNVQSLDIDGDGYPNVWDFDNDGDGVEDNIDSSPFAHSSIYDTFNFNVKTNGNPTYIDFQLRPQNPDNVRLALQEWDWPYDNKSTMQDLDNSKNDVQVIPMLELTMSSVPNQAEVKDYGIGIFSNTAYVPLVQVQGLGANVALAGKMFYPESAPLDVQVNASLIWLVMAKTDSMENGTVTDGVNIIPMFEAVPEVTFFKQIQLFASVEEMFSVSNIPGIYELSIKHPENANLMLYLSKVKSLPTDVPEAPGTVYSYFEMLFTKLKTNIKVNPETQIYFKVPKSWANSNDGITLMHYENGWQSISTEVTGEDEVNYYCTAEVDSFSIFAIVQTPPGESLVSQEIPESSQKAPEQTSTSLPQPEKQQSWFESIMSILAVLVVLGAAYYILKRKSV